MPRSSETNAAREPFGDRVLSDRDWVAAVRIGLRGMYNEQCAGLRGGFQWESHRARVWEILWNISFRYHKARGASDENAEDWGADASRRTRLAFERSLPGCLDESDPWFGKVLSNKNKDEYLRANPDRRKTGSQEDGGGGSSAEREGEAPSPPREPESAGRSRDESVDLEQVEGDGRTVHEEFEYRELQREPLRIAWRHAGSLKHDLARIPERRRRLRCLVDGAAEFYLARLDKVCPGLSGQRDEKVAERWISRVEPDRIRGLPDEPGELFEFIRPLWHGWARLTDKKVRQNFDLAALELRKEYGIHLAAPWRREGDDRDEL